MFKNFLFIVVLCLPAVASPCGNEGVVLQVLGSGGPQLNDGRSSSSYLIWVNGKARFMIDTGGGSAWRFEQSGAKFEDLQAIAFTHLHIDHVADLPIFVKGSFFTLRKSNLPLFGPSGNEVLPGFDKFLDQLFNRTNGAYKYMGSYFDPQAKAPFLFEPSTISVKSKTIQTVYQDGDTKLSAIAVMHGLLPALAWRIDVGDSAITISGDMNGRTSHLQQLAEGSDILIAHAAINQQTKGAGSFLHMKPSRIGEIAETAGIQQLILSHFMNRSSGREQEIRSQIADHYQGKIEFAEDLSCWPIDAS